MNIRVLAPGLLTTVQDLGRMGYQHLGVPVSGAMDPFALRVANLLVGNDTGNAALEITLAGPTLRFDTEDALLALAGADLGALLDDRWPVPPWRPVRARCGTTLSFRGGESGCRAYLAVAGGLAVPPVLGSRSTFVRAALGGVEGRALRAGDVLPLGAPPPLSQRIAARIRHGDAPAAVTRWGAAHSFRPAYSAAPTVRLLAGSHTNLLTPDARALLHEAEFTVSPRSDRMGYRLAGPRLELAAPVEVLSEAVAFGTVQLPPDGQPIVLMADRQPTGGYPRIGEVASVDLPLLAQLRPGDALRFQPVTLAEAHRLHRARERDLELLRAAISLHHP